MYIPFLFQGISEHEFPPLEVSHRPVVVIVNDMQITKYIMYLMCKLGDRGTLRK